MELEKKSFEPEVLQPKIEEEPLWQPTYQWLAKTGGIILGALIVIFITFNLILKPYMREMPAEVTPWLHNQPVESWGHFFSSVLPFGSPK